MIEKKFDHLSLHFDGFRLERLSIADFHREDCQSQNSRVNDLASEEMVRSFCKVLENRLERQTGYRVSLREKEHAFFEDLLQHQCVSSGTCDTGRNLLRAGDCIIYAMSCLADRPELCESAPGRMDRHLNHSQRDNLVSRSYRDVAMVMGHRLTASFRFAFRSKKRMLIHTEKGGKPHAIACRCSDDGACTLWSRGVRYICDRQVLQAICEMCLDKKAVF